MRQGAVTTAFCYDDQRVIYESQSRPEGTEERVFVFGNDIDETLVLQRQPPGGNRVEFFINTIKGTDSLNFPSQMNRPNR